MRRSIPLVVVALALPAACTVSRLGSLQRRGDRVESALKAEQRAVLATPDSPQRAARLAHLTTLRHQLSGVNIGLGATRFLEPDYRESAYDVVEQAYDTIDWNIAMPPGAAPRAMPSQWDGTTLRFAEPAPTPGATFPIQPIR